MSITVSYPTRVELLEVPAGQVPYIRTRMPAYQIASEITGANKRLYELAPTAPTLLERHYADFVHPVLMEIGGVVRGNYFIETLSEAVGPAEGEPQMEVPKDYLQVTVVSPVEEITYDEDSKLWHAVGAKRKQKVLPPNGYQAGFDQDFWPTQTLPNKEDAVLALRELGFSGDDARHFASSFMRRPEYKDFATVNLVWKWADNGPRSLNTNWYPHMSNNVLGVRMVRRLPTAERDATEAA